MPDWDDLNEWHDDVAKLERIAQAADTMVEDVVPVPYKGYEVERETFEKFVEALKDAEGLY